ISGVEPCENPERKPDHLAYNCWVEEIGNKNESSIDKCMRSPKVNDMRLMKFMEIRDKNDKRYKRGSQRNSRGRMNIKYKPKDLNKKKALKCRQKSSGDVVNDEVVRNRIMLIVSDKMEKDLREGNSDTRTWVVELESESSLVVIIVS
ncbi:22471_t:CDS:2, partial [Gigaspora margarita]